METISAVPFMLVWLQSLFTAKLAKQLILEFCDSWPTTIDGELCFKLAAEQRIAEEEKMSDAQTDSDKLELAVVLLRQMNILFRHNYCDTVSAGVSEIKEELLKYKKAIGYCFYDTQDVATAREHGVFHLSYGLNGESSDFEPLVGMVHDCITKALEAYGLSVVSDSARGTIKLAPFVWNRRISHILRKCLSGDTVAEEDPDEPLTHEVSDDEEDDEENWETEEEDPDRDVIDQMKKLIVRRLFTPEDKIDLICQIYNHFDGIEDGEGATFFQQAAEELLEEESLLDNTKKTDNDRLAEVFQMLESKHSIICRQNYQNTLSSASHHIYEELENEHKDAIGYVFYHSQDTECAVVNGKLWLAFGTNPDIEDTPEAGARVGQLVQQALKKAGLKTKWDGTVRERITVYLKWDRRIGALLTECLRSEIPQSSATSSNLAPSVSIADNNDNEEMQEDAEEYDGEEDENENYAVNMMMDAIKDGLWAPSDKASVMENMLEEYEDDLTEQELDTLFTMAAKRIVEDEQRKKSSGGGLTCNEKLNQAFDELTQQGILCRQNYDHTLSGASHEIREEMKNDHKECEGCVFYHSQDVETAKEAQHLFLAFTSNPLKDKTEAGVVRVGQKVSDVLRAHGLTVEWNQTTTSRLDVRPFVWERRISDLLKQSKCV